MVMALLAAMSIRGSTDAVALSFKPDPKCQASPEANLTCRVEYLQQLDSILVSQLEELERLATQLGRPISPAEPHADWESFRQARCGDPENINHLPTPQANLEFEVADVEAAAAELEAKGHTLLHGAKVEPWQQTIARLLSPEGLIVGICHTPWHHTKT